VSLLAESDGGGGAVSSMAKSLFVWMSFHSLPGESATGRTLKICFAISPE
jgi:hypothetical protein